MVFSSNVNSATLTSTTIGTSILMTASDSIRTTPNSIVIVVFIIVAADCVSTTLVLVPVPLLV